MPVPNAKILVEIWQLFCRKWREVGERKKSNCAITSLITVDSNSAFVYIPGKTVRLKKSTIQL